MTEKESGDFYSRAATNPQEPPPDYTTATTYTSADLPQTEPVVPSAPPASAIDQQPHQLDPYPPQPVSGTNTTTTYINVTETRTRRRTCCEDTYCPGFIFCFFIPTPCPGPGAGVAAGNCNCCTCLPPTTVCCEGGFGIASLGRVFRCAGSGDNPVIIIVMLVVLAFALIALIGLIAFFIYRLGDDKIPAIAKRYRISALVFAFVGYVILIAAGITLAAIYA